MRLRAKSLIVFLQADRGGARRGGMEIRIATLPLPVGVARLVEEGRAPGEDSGLCVRLATLGLLGVQ